MFTMLPGAPSLLGDHFKDYAWFPEQASSFAETNDRLYGVISGIGFVFFIPIAFLLFYFAWRYRKPKGTKAESQTAHNTPIELIWSIGPSFILIALFYLGAKAYLDVRTVPAGSYEINVKAFKWDWSFDYGRGTYNKELHLVLNEPTKLTMKSSDVIHSLYIPAFRAKKDVVPGRKNYMWFQPSVTSEKVSEAELAKATQWTKESGQPWNHDKWQFTEHGYRFFDLYCAEYCGTNHSQMQTVVVVHETRDELDAWIKKVSARGGDVTLEEWGKKLYEGRGCVGCHTLDGKAASGPSYKDAFGTKRKLQNGDEVMFDENYVRESIINPKAKVAQGFAPVMPSFKGQLSDDDIDSLTAFIKLQSSNAAAQKPAEDAAADEAPTDQAPTNQAAGDKKQ